MISFALMALEQCFIKPSIMRRRKVFNNSSLSLKNRKEELSWRHQEVAIFDRTMKSARVYLSPLLDTYVKMGFVGVVRNFYALLLFPFFFLFSLFTPIISLTFVQVKEFLGDINLLDLEFSL